MTAGAARCNTSVKDSDDALPGPGAVAGSSSDMDSTTPGDTFPVTPAGRGIAAALIVAGIALFGVLTANIATFFIEQHEDVEVDPVVARSDEVLLRLDAIEQRLLAEDG